jgi:hypothetical protein
MNRRRRFNVTVALGLAGLAAPRLSARAEQSAARSEAVPVATPWQAVWKRYPLARYPQAIASETKHTRWAYRTATGEWYVNGGDYSHPREQPSALDSGSNNTWRVNLRDNTWERVSGYWPKEGETVPSHPDETIWVYDSKRDVFWHGAGYQWAPFSPGADAATSPIPASIRERMVYRHWMSFDPKTKKWTDHGPYAGPAHPKHGVYDAQTDRIFAPYTDGGFGNALMIFHCATGQWEAGVRLRGPNLGDQKENYFSFDTRRRELVFLSRKDFSCHGYAIDTGAWRELRAEKRPPVRMANTYALAYHPKLDVHVLHGGRTPETRANNNDLWVIPAGGGDCQPVVTTGDPPIPLGNQVLLYEPKMEALVSFGGTGGSAPPASYHVATLRRT